MLAPRSAGGRDAYYSCLLVIGAGMDSRQTKSYSKRKHQNLFQDRDINLKLPTTTWLHVTIDLGKTIEADLKTDREADWTMPT